MCIFIGLHGLWIVIRTESFVSSCFKWTRWCQGYSSKSWYGDEDTINACIHVFRPSTSISNIWKLWSCNTLPCPTYSGLIPESLAESSGIPLEFWWILVEWPLYPRKSEYFTLPHLFQPDFGGLRPEFHQNPLESAYSSLNPMLAGVLANFGIYSSFSLVLIQSQPCFFTRITRIFLYGSKPEFCRTIPEILAAIRTETRLKPDFSVTTYICYIFTILYFYSTLFPLWLPNSLVPRTHGYTRYLYPDSFLYLLLIVSIINIWLISIMTHILGI